MMVLGWVLLIGGIFGMGLFVGQLIERRHNIKEGTPSTSHNTHIAEIAEEIEYMSYTLDTITKDGLIAKMKQWYRQLRNM